MAHQPPQPPAAARPRRAAASSSSCLFGLLAAVHTWGDGAVTPKLGLDLEGGTQIDPRARSSAPTRINQGQLNQARDIIRQRVDANGVAEAEVTTQGGRNIVVAHARASRPQSTLDALSKSSQLRFRAVLVAGADAAPAPAPSATRGTPSADRHAAEAGPTPATVAQGDRRRRRPASTPPTASPTRYSARPRRRPTPTPVAPRDGRRDARRPTPRPRRRARRHARPAANAGQDAERPGLDHRRPSQAQFTALDCTNPERSQAIVDDPTKPLVTCRRRRRREVHPRPGRGRRQRRSATPRPATRRNQHGQPTTDGRDRADLQR